MLHAGCRPSQEETLCPRDQQIKMVVVYFLTINFTILKRMNIIVEVNKLGVD
jgi:hypothetical protein